MARKSRPEPTLADYMAIAISPALIIVLVSSVAFFLLTLSYGGAFEGAAQWTMGCFCFAAVLISRVSIVEGAERAAMFGVVLAAAVGIAMVKYVAHPWIIWIVLGVIWAFASQLVWNCTLVDDGDDASGEGLLEAAGLEGNESDKKVDAAAVEAGAATKSKKPPKQFPSKKEREEAAMAAAAPPPPPPPPLWRRLWEWWKRGADRSAPPGIWVIYCSLVALPIFGFGQWLMDRDSRAYGFTLIFRYVAAAMLLLLTTSFLGLRRYLRQRRVEMPLKMAGVWLGVGVAMVAAILLLAQLIPRPNPDYSLASLGRWLTSPSRQASDNALLKKSTGEGNAASTAPAEKQPEETKSTEANAEKQKGEVDSSSQSGEGKAGEQSKGPSGEPAADGKQPPQGDGQSGEKGGGKQGKEQGQSPDGKSSGGEKSKSNESPPGERQPGDQQPTKQQPGQQPADSKTEQDPGQAKQQSQNKSGHEQQQREQSKSGKQQNDNQQDDKAKRERDEREKKREQERLAKRGYKPPPKPADGKSSWVPSFGWLGTLLKGLFYLVAAIAAIYFLIRYWSEVRDWLARLWQEFLDLWNSLFGGKQKQEAIAAAAAAEEARPQPRPFAAFQDPFVSGDAARNKPSAVVQYSFEALEAWARERGVARQQEETPLEFAGRLTAQVTDLGADAQELANLYARVAYARDPLSPASLTNVERLWKTLQRTARPSPLPLGEG